MPKDMDEAELGYFIDSQAREGCPSTSRFNCESWAFSATPMHVVSAPHPGFAGHGSEKPIAIQDEERAGELWSGEVVGVQLALDKKSANFQFSWDDNSYYHPMQKEV